MNSRKNYQAPTVEVLLVEDVITTSFTEDKDPGQGEWDGEVW